VSSNFSPTSTVWFPGAFTKLRKTFISFVISVRLSVCLCVRIKKSASHWSEFHEIWYFCIFRKFVEKIQLSSKSDENYGYFTCKPTYILSYLVQSFLEWEMFHTKVVEKIRTHIFYSAIYFRKSCRLWGNVEKYCRAGQATDRRQYDACALHARYLRLQIHTLRLCNSHCFSRCCFVPTLPVLLTLSSLTTYIYMSYRTANLQMLHFKYLFNKYPYWIF
jgi:hypothetical protein